MKKNDLYDAFLNNREKNIDKWHHYFEIYEDNFAQYKDKDILLLEIGVFKGGSLNLWKNRILNYKRSLQNYLKTE